MINCMDITINNSNIETSFLKTVNNFGMLSPTLPESVVLTSLERFSKREEEKSVDAPSHRAKMLVSNSSSIPHPHQLIAPRPALAVSQPPPDSVTAVDNEKKPMKSQRNRLLSYINWPCTFVTADALAEQGFFYTQKSDIVRCAFCGLELGKWEAGDVPAADHRTWSPHCPLIRGVECGNVCMSDSERASCPTSAADDLSFDTCGKYGIHVRPNSGPENGRPVDVQRYAVKHTSAAHPQYALVEERLRTFKDWPVSIKQRPEELAPAGFYYSGKSDQTICYSCGGGLKAWEPSDDPWEQHASWFPQCTFLRMNKSADFIALHNKTGDEKGRLPKPSTSASGVEARAPVSSLNSPQAPPSPAAAAAVTTKDPPSGTPLVNLCKICYTNEIGVVFLPCGHMVACTECASALTRCAVCRLDLEATVRAYLS